MVYIGGFQGGVCHQAGVSCVQLLVGRFKTLFRTTGDRSPKYNRRWQTLHVDSFSAAVGGQLWAVDCLEKGSCSACIPQIKASLAHENW